MILRGRIVADCVVIKGTDSGQPGGTCAPSTAPNPFWTTEIWGNNDIDTFQLGDPSGSISFRGLEDDAGSDGYIFLGSKTIVRGSNSAVTAGDAGHNPSVADGEDNFLVVPPVDERRDRPARAADVGVGAGHVLTSTARPTRTTTRLHERQPRLDPQLRHQRPRHGSPQ
jgi:hypothetical protein